MPAPLPARLARVPFHFPARTPYREVQVSREAGCRKRPNRTLKLLLLLLVLTLPLLKLTFHALLVLLALGEDDQNQLPLTCLLVLWDSSRKQVEPHRVIPFRGKQAHSESGRAAEQCAQPLLPVPAGASLRTACRR